MAKNDMQFPRPTNKSSVVMADEWDHLAPKRNDQISAGKDLSFEYVLKPTIETLSKGCNLERVLDLGCGTGQLAAVLAVESGQIVGVDVSSKSIEIANQNCAEFDNVTFVVGSVEGLADDWNSPPFTTVVANMMLMTCINLRTCLSAVSNMISTNGKLIATITHPFFWPHYRGYAEADWFSYEQEIVIEAPFKISRESTENLTTHIHRPLSMYTDCLFQQGFIVENMVEPLPMPAIQGLYPDPWDYPRFLGFRATMSR